MSVWFHYSAAIMGAMTFHITGFSIVSSTVCSGADQRKHQSSASLAFVRGNHQWPMNYTHKQITRKMFPLDDVIIGYWMTRMPFSDCRNSVLWYTCSMHFRLPKLSHVCVFDVWIKRVFYLHFIRYHIVRIFSHSIFTYAGIMWHLISLDSHI